MSDQNSKVLSPDKTNQHENNKKVTSSPNKKISNFNIFEKYPLHEIDPSYRQPRDEAQGMHVQQPKTWTGIPMMSKHPLFCIQENSDLEPLYHQSDRLYEDCQKKESDRMANPSILMNRLVQDSFEPSPLQDRRDMATDGYVITENNRHSDSSHNKSVTSEKLADISSKHNNKTQHEPRADKGGRSNSAQLDELNNLDIWQSKKREEDVWGRERADGTLPPYQQLQSDKDETLVFESRFESGNLRRAIQVQEQEQDLILKPDQNTRGNTQWFQFSVSNVRKNKEYKFNIINLLKNDSLQNQGLKPLAYSEKGARMYQILTGNHMYVDAQMGLQYNNNQWKNNKHTNTFLKKNEIGKMWGWRRVGQNICQQQNSIKRRTTGFQQTLTFTVKFDFDRDTVYFCHSQPYTYTNLNRWLGMLEEDKERLKVVKRRLLCQTIAGNACDYLTITDFSTEHNDRPQMKEINKNSGKKNKLGVVISARVHPGETQASFMLQGLVDFLSGPSELAKLLRAQFVFKVVPMLNVDGVVNGSNRCNLAGVDLNRQWQDPSRRLHPTIFAAKGLIRRFMDEREVVLFCDFHAHSRKKNIFMQGNSGAKNPDNNFRYRERIFPKLLEGTSPIFSFEDCSFVISKNKESCGRVVCQKEIGLVNSQTLEASYCGPDHGIQKDYHFNTQMTQEIGKNFCEAVADMFCEKQAHRLKSCMKSLDSMSNIDIRSGQFKPQEDSGGESDSDDKEKGALKTKSRKI